MARRVLKALRRTPLHPQWLLGNNRATRAELGRIGDGAVLDIGCADRWVERTLAPACRYIAIDYPETGQKMYHARPDVFADASKLPFGDLSIASVVMLEVLEHLRHPALALQEIARVLQPRGRLYLTVPFLYPVHDAPHDYQRYTAHGLVREVEAVGLQVEHLRPNLGAAETAGLMACLAMAGMALEALRRRSPALLLLPVLAAGIPITNLVAWTSARLLPSWPALTAGYLLVASKP